MKKTSSAILIAVLILATVFPLFAGGKKDTSAKTDTKTVIKFCNFNASGGQEATLDAMYAAFSKLHPDIVVEIETIGYNDYFTQMQTRVAGGTAPDCYELNIENFAAYANKGLLAEIAGVDTAGINKTALSAFTVAGKQYGLPGCFSNVVLIYNKDLFDQAGVSYPDVSWTWTDVQKAAEKIHALGDDYFGIFAPITYNEFFKVAAQFGGSILNSDKTAFTVNSPECIAAARTMIERVTVSNVQPDTAQQGGMGDWDWFMSGRLGMIPTGIWAFNTFSENCAFNWDITVEPGQVKKATHFFSNAYVVNRDSKNAQAATEWITFLASSPEAAKIRISAGWDLPAITDQAVLASYLAIEKPANRKAVFESLDYLTVPPIIEQNALMGDIITKHLQQAADKKVSIEQALNDAQAELTASIHLK
jgi:multiple sugar transport system substrate-binding protein